ncbi:MAG: inositol monophosphatase family protein [Albidovulum sp.]
MNDEQIEIRYRAAVDIARRAGDMARDYFDNFHALTIDVKGHQDFVSEADRNVEVFVRAALAEAFAQDGIVGEEDAPVAGSSGFTWVIDPVDGTTNFIHGIPAWTVVLACVAGPDTVIGVVHDPVHGETHHARRGGGAFLNDRSSGCLNGRSLKQGSLGIGFSGRTRAGGVKRLVSEIIDAGGVFYRNGSGALSLAYVASGRLLGYVEEHMNAWDCLAGQLIVAEAGGVVEEQDAQDMIVNGGRVIVGTAETFGEIMVLAETAYAAHWG